MSLTLKPIADGSAIIQIGGVDQVTVKPNGTMVAQTNPTSFDDSNTLAPISYVKKSVGGNKLWLTASTNTTLTAESCGKIYGVSGSGTIITLPVASAVPSGACVEIKSMDQNSQSVARQSSDTITLGTGFSSLTSVSMLSGETLRLVSNGVDTWVAISGSTQTRNLRYKSSTGYKISPNGLITCWGSGVSSTAAVTITLPVTYTIAPLAIGSILNADVNKIGGVSYNSSNTTSITITVRGTSTGVNTQFAGYTVNYITIGY
jgi:hypothetical protein